MGKNKKDAPKKKAAEAAPLSKKERKAAEKRAAEIAAELDRREKKAAKKALAKSDKAIGHDGSKKSAKKVTKKVEKAVGKKGKGSKKAEPSEPAADLSATEAEAIAAAKAARKAAKKADDLPSREEIIEAADKVLASPDSSDGAKASATTAKAAATEASPDESTADIRARVQRKAARRKELEALAASIDRADVDAVRAYNEEAVKLGLTLLTSDEEREKVHAAVAHEVEVVETEQGREFAAGPDLAYEASETQTVTAIMDGNVVVDFAKPSEAPRTDFEVNGLGQYKVKRPSDGKMVGYTRVTTYIDAIEDTSRLVAWKLRTLLEGVALASEPGEREDAVSSLRDLTHRRDVAIAKARKKDRKNELEPGELAQRVAAAEKEFKAAVDKLADELLDLGGAKDKANKGTNLHALFEIVDDPKRGLPEIHRMRAEDVITPADVRDCIAWADAMATLGAKVIDIERVIVNDAVPVPRFLPEAEYGGKPPKTIGVAGRLDRTAMVKLPGRQRAGRYVVDAKTGSTLEYSAGKIARQLHMYANAQGYDLETHEREDLKLDKKTAIVIHVPAGSGKAHVYLVDLTMGAKGNKVAADVRAMRNEGKKAIDLSVDLLEIIRAEEKSA